MNETTKVNEAQPTDPTSTGVRYPKIKVKLVGTDGNAFSILGNVRRALRKARVSQEEIEAFSAEAMSGDYNHLLATCMRWVDVS